MKGIWPNLPAFEATVRLLDTIPGVNRMTAVTIVAEIGIDMTRFPSDRHLAAWAGVACTSNKSKNPIRIGYNPVRQKNLIRESGSHCRAAGEHFVKQCMGLVDSESMIVHPNGTIEMAGR